MISKICDNITLEEMWLNLSITHISEWSEWSEWSELWNTHWPNADIRYDW